MIQYKAIVFTCLYWLSSTLAYAQYYQVIDSGQYAHKKDVIDVLHAFKFSNDSAELLKPKRITKKVQIALVPTVAAVPGSGGFAFITAVNASFLLGPPQTTNMSNVYFTPYTNFSGKYVFPLTSYVWSANNKWNWVGDYRYYIYPRYTYGFGADSKQSDRTLIEYNHLRLHQRVLRKITGPWLAGFGYHLDYHHDVKEFADDVSKAYISAYDGVSNTSTVSSGVSVSTAVDSRANAANAQQGIYAAIVYKWMPTWLGSSSQWQSIYTDIRLYHSFNPRKQNVIACWFFYWDILNGKAPYLDLPSTAWDQNYRSGRGYYQGRFTGTGMAYGEVEYRFDLTQNGLWGATVFANMQSLRNPNTQQFEQYAPAIGSGLRLKFNKYSNNNLTADIAFGRNSWNYYFGIAEYF